MLAAPAPAPLTDRALARATLAALGDEDRSLAAELEAYARRGAEAGPLPPAASLREAWARLAAAAEDPDLVLLAWNVCDADRGRKRPRLDYEVERAEGSHRLGADGRVVHVLEARVAGEEAPRAQEFASPRDYREAVRDARALTADVAESPFAELFLQRGAAPPPAPYDFAGVPAATRAAIRPHQRAALETALGPHGGRSLVTLAPGLGKTLIGCLFAHRYLRGSRASAYNRVLVICPASKVRDWQAEFAQWTGRSQKIRAVSFEKARLRVADLAAVRWRAVVVDECHQLKNRASMRTLALGPFLASQKRVLLLSGTPQPNRPEELLPLLRVLDPARFADPRRFEDRYCAGSGLLDEERETRGSSHVEELRALLSLYSFRDDAAVATPFALVRHRVDVMPSPAQEDAMRELDEGLTVRTRAWKRAVRQKAPFSVRQGLLDRVKTHLIRMWREAGEAKAGSVLPYIEGAVLPERGPLAPDNKLVVFCHHTEKVARVVCAELEARWPGRVVYIDGDVPLAERDARIRRLRDPADGSALVGVLTTGAVGEGVNLVPAVRTVVFAELEHRPAAMLQAEKRIHRVGSAGDAHAYWLVLEGSADERVLGNLDRKLGVIARTVGGPSSVVFSDTV